MLLGTLSAASCGDAGDTDPETSANEDASSSSAEDVPEYNWASLDCGEGDFVLLNSTDEYGFYDYIDFEATTGERLDDKVFERNRELEDRYKFRLKVIDENFNDASTKLRQAVSSDSDDYDAAFVWVNNLSGMLSDGCFTNLSDVKTLNLDSAWWDTATDNDMKIGNSGKLYFAFCNTSLVKFEGTQSIFLNQSKMERLGLDMPYQLVRDGKWTLDELNKLASAGANLNGDDSFKWDKSNNAEYGILGCEGTAYGLIYSTENRFIEKDKDGIPYFAAGSEHFYDSLSKISSILSVDGQYIYLNYSGDDHYEAAFKNGRGLMLTAELKAASKYRDMDDGFGIVPYPKYDEKQENYIAIGGFAHATAIPSTSNDPERAGAILDGLAYLTNKDVMPEFYENTMSQKRLRDDESIEMLGIITDSFYLDPGEIYSWTHDLRETLIRKLCHEKKTDFASTVEKFRPGIDESITNTVLEFQD